MVGQYNLGNSSPAFIPTTLANGNYWIKIKAIDLATNETDSNCSSMYSKVNTGFSFPSWAQFDNGTNFSPVNGMKNAKTLVSKVSGPPEVAIFGGLKGTAMTSRAEFRPIGGVPSIQVFNNAGGQAFIESAVANDPNTLDFYVFSGMTQAGTFHTGTNVFNKYTFNINGATTLSTTGAPSSRVMHTMSHTGTKLCVWGGYTNTGMTTTASDGACYDIGGTTWSSMATAPISSRAKHVAEWTGTKVCIWGGNGDGASPTTYNDGACYNPVGNTWNTMSTSPLTARTNHKSVWTGQEMCIWGGENPLSTTSYEDGACYNPVANTWRLMGGTKPSLGRVFANMLWTGARICIVGGFKKYISTSQETTSSCWSPIYNDWQNINTTGLPATLESGSVFFEDDLCLFGGYSNTGAPTPVSTTTCVKLR
ncbi:MAG: hypothetical protein COW01_05965 [Bdellovibrionales bacterium CG12_big_fil_rev_8_21_14_0_65_38_15]|nr:MAG: hypothetical protein COW79_03860 [Bdellovibrionales bacterium CG22_combo_CG10-13_8_21_14_all_38_13]PIQ55977.1 MAG: hypothetical protein COW01_05965 [Bdellovibrionales bacterium CG12_big_fil_rev_8_21_14_0_65_38_15]